MSFCPTVREEWRNKLPSITHVDNTARVQTVTREQNAWLYDLLTEFADKTGVGVLLNTSFNVNGKPILSTLREAFQVFDNTNMDGLVIEDYYFRKTEFRPTISYDF
jgi:predicted NodU family carbamoyl transferase